jgi:DNA helicase IV
MNLNDYPEDLKQEEQKQLDILIKNMNRFISRLDDRMQEYVKEANDARNVGNTDAYASIVLARRKMLDTKENRRQIIEARDELYRMRVLLKIEDSYSESVEEFKVGLHSCIEGGRIYVASWTMPVFRHYVLGGRDDDFDGIIAERGDQYETHFTLLAKEDIKLRFTKVIQALNLFPGSFDKESLERILDTDFFSKAFVTKMIDVYDSASPDVTDTEKIIADEFLRELLERRASTEFKNIVFSVQKKQSEIIQAAYDRNMIVQGCAGSGKSMIMLHRLPIVLYDNPNSLDRSNLYIITPSQAYMSMAQNMRRQLEIEDINMGTLRQYYDYCISKYRRKPEEYGKIRNDAKLSREQTRYVYSADMINDVCSMFEGMVKQNPVDLTRAYRVLGVKEKATGARNTYFQIITQKAVEVQEIIKENKKVLTEYFRIIREALIVFADTKKRLTDHRDNVLLGIERTIKLEEEKIQSTQENVKESEALKNFQAAFLASIEESQKNIAEYDSLKEKIQKGEEHYFEQIERIIVKLSDMITPYENVNKDFEKNEIDKVYELVEATGGLIGMYYALSWEVSRLDVKYDHFIADPKQKIRSLMNEMGKTISTLQTLGKEYLEKDYFKQLCSLGDSLQGADQVIVAKAYAEVMHKLGNDANAQGRISGLPCSPYVYLQILYLFYGTPTGPRESFLSIDEAQGLSLSELLLLKNINGGKVVFNLFGDVRQHIEDEKGITDWKEVTDEFDCDFYEMHENYRNASQITEYCNKEFDMKMVAINTPGNGVHVWKSFDEFVEGIQKQFMGGQKAGAAAIIVKDELEATMLLDKFKEYADKMNDMTGEEFSLHTTRWNILTIEDAKGLEFTSIIAISGRMSNNEKYIAYTRALDELFVFDEAFDLAEYEKNARKIKNDKAEQVTKQTEISTGVKEAKPAKKIKKDKNVGITKKSELREFFEEYGLKVVDNRASGGMLWLIGEKDELQMYINEAASKFGSIQGKFMASKEIGNRNGWCSTTKK